MFAILPARPASGPAPDGRAGSWHPEATSPRNALRFGRTGLAVAVLVAVSAALRAWAGRGVPTPWIAPDEMIYALLGQSLYREGRLAILGDASAYYSLVVPAVAGLPLRLDDLELGYAILKPLQALAMSLAAVPVYLWGRTLAGARWALLAAALTLALPALAYSGLVMTEPLFYLVAPLAVWAAAAALERPTIARQALLLAATALAVATRIQAAVLVPAFLTAAALDAAMARRRPRLAPLLPALGGFALGIAGWVGWRLVSGGGLLAGYAGAGGGYAAGPAAEFVAYHLADAALLTGVAPLAALTVCVAQALRRGEPDPRLRAFLAVAAAVTAWIVVQVGIFASREVGLLAERNLLVVAPLAFLAFAVWLSRGGRGGYWLRALAALALAAAILTLPFDEMIVPEALHDAFTLVPLVHLRLSAGLGAAELAVALAVAILAGAFVLARGRALVLVPALVVVTLASLSGAAAREVVVQASEQQRRLLGPDRRWVDRHADGPVAYVYDGQVYWNAVWENLFWNRRIRHVWTLPGFEVPGPVPQLPLVVRRDGELRPEGRRASVRYAIVPLRYELRGRLLAEAPQYGTDRLGLALWRVDPPLRLSTIAAGLFPNGDVDRAATLTAYGCRGGRFEADLLVKEPQTVRVYLDGRVVHVRRFAGEDAWKLRLRVPREPAGGARICKLKVSSSGLLGTTRFAFVRPAATRAATRAERRAP